jgi:hypothetical protein
MGTGHSGQPTAYFPSPSHYCAITGPAGGSNLPESPGRHLGNHLRAMQLLLSKIRIRIIAAIESWQRVVHAAAWSEIASEKTDSVVYF